MIIFLRNTYAYDRSRNSQRHKSCLQRMCVYVFAPFSDLILKMVDYNSVPNVWQNGILIFFRKWVQTLVWTGTSLPFPIGQTPATTSEQEIESNCFKGTKHSVEEHMETLVAATNVSEYWRHFMNVNRITLHSCFHLYFSSKIILTYRVTLFAITDTDHYHFYSEIRIQTKYIRTYTQLRKDNTKSTILCKQEGIE